MAGNGIFRKTKDSTGHGYHSRAYHRHFEGYSEYETIGSDGRTRINRVYTGKYYTPVLNKSGLRLRKLLYATLWLAAVAVFIIASLIPAASNSTWYSSLSQLGIIIGLVWTAMGIVHFIFSSARRTIGAYKASHNSIIYGTTFTTIFFGCCLVSSLAFAIISSSFGSGLQLSVIFLFIFGAGFVLAIRKLESSVIYNITSDNMISPEDAVEIS